MRRFALLLAALVLPRLAHAQSHPLVGEWSVSYVGGMRIENGERVPLTVKGVLTVATEGDSLIATLKSEPIEGQPARPPARFAAKSAAGKVTFVQRSEATLNMNGEQSKRTAISTYILEATVDTLTGTLARQIEGLDIPIEPQPFNGTRAK
jgi:hypothetical protein